ncbi:MAG: type IV pilus assembly protein PilM [Parcubacteria group bacterium]|jgi:type IV pilus assembly protein PilM
MQFKLFGKKSNAFGLEIEDGSLKAFRLEKKRDEYEISAFSKKDIKKGLVTEGVVVNAAELAKEIRDLMSSSKCRPIKCKQVIFSIPETKSFIRTIRIPKMSREEAGEAVKWETEANIPIAVDMVYLDWQVIRSDENQEEVLVAAVPKTVVDAYCEAMKQAGISPIAVEIDIIATIRSLTTAENNRKPTLIVDIGAEKTSLAICKDQIPYFTSSIPLCGKTFTDALQKEVGVGKEKAEEIKYKYGLGRMRQDDTLFKVYNPLLENLASEIDRSISFYSESINTEEKVEDIILSGGGALMIELVDYLNEKVKKRVVLGDPFIGVKIKKGSQTPSPEDILSYATSIGLALRNFSYDD